MRQVGNLFAAFVIVAIVALVLSRGSNTASLIQGVFVNLAKMLRITGTAVQPAAEPAKPKGQ